MTICISLICDENTLIVSSDKKITATYPPIEFEQEKTKLEELSSTCIALTAGDALDHIDLFREVKSEIKSLIKPEISLIVEKIKDSFVKLRRKRGEELYLKPLSLSFETFYAGLKSLPPEITFPILKRIEQENVELHILVCGLDEGGPHIYRIFDPGISKCFDSLGFNAVGSGEMHAISYMISKKCSPSMKLNEAVYNLFVAKKKAEVAPGVGESTSIAIINKKGITYLNETQLSILSETYKRGESSTEEIPILFQDENQSQEEREI